MTERVSTLNPKLIFGTKQLDLRAAKRDIASIFQKLSLAQIIKFPKPVMQIHKVLIRLWPGQHSRGAFNLLERDANIDISVWSEALFWIQPRDRPAFHKHGLDAALAE